MQEADGEADMGEGDLGVGDGDGGMQRGAGQRGDQEAAVELDNHMPLMNEGEKEDDVHRKTNLNAESRINTVEDEKGEGVVEKGKEEDGDDDDEDAMPLPSESERQGELVRKLEQVIPCLSPVYVASTTHSLIHSLLPH